MNDDLSQMRKCTIAVYARLTGRGCCGGLRGALVDQLDIIGNRSVGEAKSPQTGRVETTVPSSRNGECMNENI